MSELLEAGIPWTVFNFVVFVGMLFFLLRKPVKEFWITRSHEIRFAVTEAERVKREAKEKYDDLKKRLARLEVETKELIHQMHQEGEMEKKGIMEQVERLAQRTREDSERIMAQEVRKAREALKIEAVNLAIEFARKTIADNLQEADQKRLSDQYLNRLEGDVA